MSVVRRIARTVAENNSREWKKIVKARHRAWYAAMAWWFEARRASKAIRRDRAVRRQKQEAKRGKGPLKATA